MPSSRRSSSGSLTEEEYDVIRKHSEWGEELLAKLGFPGDVRRLVRNHHERLDGSGYPFGAYGDQLDIASLNPGVRYDGKRLECCVPGA